MMIRCLFVFLYLACIAIDCVTVRYASTDAEEWSDGDAWNPIRVPKNGDSLYFLQPLGSGVKTFVNDICPCSLLGGNNVPEGDCEDDAPRSTFLRFYIGYNSSRASTTMSLSGNGICLNGDLTVQGQFNISNPPTINFKIRFPNDDDHSIILGDSAYIKEIEANSVNSNIIVSTSGSRLIQLTVKDIYESATWIKRGSGLLQMNHTGRDTYIKSWFVETGTLLIGNAKSAYKRLDSIFVNQTGTFILDAFNTVPSKVKIVSSGAMIIRANTTIASLNSTGSIQLSNSSVLQITGDMQIDKIMIVIVERQCPQIAYSGISPPIVGTWDLDLDQNSLAMSGCQIMTSSFPSAAQLYTSSSGLKFIMENGILSFPLPPTSASPSTEQDLIIVSGSELSDDSKIIIIAVISGLAVLIIVAVIVLVMMVMRRRRLARSQIMPQIDLATMRHETSIAPEAIYANQSLAGQPLYANRPSIELDDAPLYGNRPKKEEESMYGNFKNAKTEEHQEPLYGNARPQQT